jgi:hypothetical protein
MLTFHSAVRLGLPATLLLVSACAHTSSAGVSPAEVRLIEERITQIPLCTALGKPALAFMVPADEELATFRRTIVAAVPEGIVPEFFDQNQAPPLLDRVRVQRGLVHLMQGYSSLQGSTVTVLLLDEMGHVNKVVPNSGDKDLDRRLVSFWQRQRFLRVRHEGCRLPVWIRVETTFDTNPSNIRLQVRYPAIDWGRVRESEDLWACIDL